MDDADLSQQLEQAIIAAALNNRQSAPVSPDGICIWCEDQPVVANSAFCSAECGVDYQKYHREMKQRLTDANGG